MQLRDWIRTGEARLLAGPHPERARLDAETLLLHFTGRNRAWLLAHAGDEFGGCTSLGYATLLDRRFRGEPIQYIIGEAEFYGLPFHVTPDVLIPRPETEHLVDAVLEGARRFDTPRIADIGTGSGAIAVTLARALPAAQVTAIDLSLASLAVARQNAERHSAPVRFIAGDLLVPVAGETFDVIVSNPPYVPESDRPTLAVEVREHEPALALFAGPDGFAVYRRLIPQAFAALAPGGFIALEYGYGQSDDLYAMLNAAGFHNVQQIPDLQGIPRVAIARRP